MDFDDERVLKSLFYIASNPKENDTVLNSCGESLGAIWTRSGIFDEKKFRAMAGTARHGVYIVVKSRKPEWVEKYQLASDKFTD